MPQIGERRAKVRLPGWLFGNDLLGFAADAGLKLHPDDASTLRWEVETLESFENRAPTLCSVETIAGPGFAPNWAALAVPSGVRHSVDAATLEGERERMLGPDATLTSLAAWVKLSTVAATDRDAPAAAQAAFEAIVALPAEDGDSPFRNASVHFIKFDECLGKRSGLTRVLVRVEEEPDLLMNRPEPGPGEMFFQSGWQLHSDLSLTRDAYLAPLYLCLSPWIWAFVGARIPGVVVYDLGTSIVGRPGQASEPLQLFLNSGATVSTQRPAVGPTEISAALIWWVTHLNIVLSELTDPSNYLSHEGTFRPRRQFEVLLGVEQLGRRIQSILISERDLPTRRLLGFAALDTLEGLGVIAFDQACRLSQAQATLDRLEAALSATEAVILLPTARRAVEALRHCQDGFFLTSRVTPSTVGVPDRSGQDRVLTKEDAVAQYLRILRNAVHGFTGENDSQRRRDEVLLMAHDGNIPGDVSFLPYLYWLDVLLDPSRWRRRLAPRR